MSEVWKFGLALRRGVWQSVGVPDGAQVVHFAEQDGVLCFWALVDPYALENEELSVAVVYTGEQVPNGGRYVGTCMDSDELVWHLFVREAGR